MPELITLTKGYFATVDAVEYERLSKSNWQAIVTPLTVYASRKGKSGEPSIVMMHRDIVGFGPTDPRIDHKDGDGLNNRRLNLRPCTFEQNQHNRRVSKISTCGFKGVHRQKLGGSRQRAWMARITVASQRFFLGYFDTPEEAAKAYDEAAIQKHGEFARLNFPK